MAMRDGTYERRRELYLEALGLIAHEYAQPLTLDSVARRLATSRRQLQRVLAEQGNTTFREVLTYVRMRHARRLLAAAQIQVRDIAASVGYPEPAQFAKSFRRHHGDSPSGFRAQTIGVDAAAVRSALEAAPQRPVLNRPIARPRMPVAA